MVKKNDNTNKIDKFVSNNILYFRHKHGMTRKILATAIDVSNQQLNKYEDGTNRVSIGRLVLIANALGEPVEAFYKDVNIKSVKIEKTPAQELHSTIVNNLSKITKLDYLHIINSVINGLLK